MWPVLRRSQLGRPVVKSECLYTTFLHWFGADDWCIDAKDPDGKHAESPGYKYEGPDGDTKAGQCS